MAQRNIGEDEDKTMVKNTGDHHPGSRRDLKPDATPPAGLDEPLDLLSFQALKDQARAYAIRGGEDMDRDQLIAALKDLRERKRADLQ